LVTFSLKVISALLTNCFSSFFFNISLALSLASGDVPAEITLFYLYIEKSKAAFYSGFFRYLFFCITSSCHHLALMARLACLLALRS